MEKPRYVNVHRNPKYYLLEKIVAPKNFSNNNANEDANASNILNTKFEKIYRKFAEKKITAHFRSRLEEDLDKFDALVAATLMESAVARISYELKHKNDADSPFNI